MTNLKPALLCIFISLGLAYNSLSFAGGNSISNQPYDYYFAISTGRTEIDFDDEDVDVNVVKFKGGVFLQENVALELNLGTGLSDATMENHIDVVDIDSLYSLLFRLQSPHYQGFRIYFLGGYSQVELAKSVPLNSTTRTDSLNGGTLAMGFEQKVSDKIPTWIYLDYNRIFDDIKVNVLDVGVRVDF